MTPDVENTQTVVVTAESVFRDVDRKILEATETVNQCLRIEFLQIKIISDRTDLVTLVTFRRSGCIARGDKMARVVVDRPEIATASRYGKRISPVRTA